LAVASIGGWVLGFFLLVRMSFRLPLASSVGFAVVVGFLTSGLCAVLAYHDPGDGTPEPASTLPFLILGLCGGYLVALGSFVYHRLKCSHERQA